MSRVTSLPDKIARPFGTTYIRVETYGDRVFFTSTLWLPVLAEEEQGPTCVVLITNKKPSCVIMLVSVGRKGIREVITTSRPLIDRF